MCHPQRKLGCAENLRKYDMEGEDCKKSLKNINGDELAKELFFFDLMERNRDSVSYPGRFENI